MNLVPVAYLTRPLEIIGVIHPHACCALYERFDNKCCCLGMMFRQIGFKRSSGPQRIVPMRLSFCRITPVGSDHMRALAQQRCIGIREQCNVGDRQGAQRLAMVAVLQTDKRIFFRADRYSASNESSSSKQFPLRKHRRCCKSNGRACREQACSTVPIIPLLAHA